MNRTIAFLLILGVIGAFGMAAHPLYLSIADMYYNEEAQSLEISLKLFQDDLEVALEEEMAATNLQLGSPYEVEQADSLVAAYLQRHFQLQLEGKRIGLNFLGKEMEGQVIWAYLEGVELPQPGTIQVKNSLLDMLPGQRNIVHLRVGGERKSVLLQKDHWREEISFP